MAWRRGLTLSDIKRGCLEGSFFNHEPGLLIPQEALPFSTLSSLAWKLEFIDKNDVYFHLNVPRIFFPLKKVCLKCYMHLKVHCSTVYNSQDMEAT